MSTATTPQKLPPAGTACGTYVNYLGALRQCSHFKQDLRNKKASFMRLILIRHAEPELVVWQHYEATSY